PGQGVVAGNLVLLPGPDQADALRPTDPAHERNERAATGIGVMEIFDDEQHGLTLRQAPDDTEQPLEDSPLATLRRRGGRSVGERTSRRESPDGFREETNDVLGRRASKVRELRVVDGLEERAKRPDARPVWLVKARPVRPTADHGKGVVESGDAAAELRDESGYADAPEALEEDGRRDAVRRRFERRGKPDERCVASHEPR